MNSGHFHIPGDATRRRYGVYIMIARDRVTGHRSYYVGKTGDNRQGCNPIISRAGNHFSYNKMHSQIRNLITAPEDSDFDFFYRTFSDYAWPLETRDSVDQINAFERHLNRRAQEVLGEALLNPYRGKKQLPLEANTDEIEALIREVLSFIRDEDQRFLSGSS